MSRESVIMAALVTLLVGLTSPVPALDTPNERITLVGLTGVHVVVYEMRTERDGEGPTRSSLQAELEKRLRRAGLRPLGATEAIQSVGRPTLELRVNLARSRHARELYVYSVDLALRQQIQLARARTIESFVITWSEPPDIGTVEPGQLSIVLDAVRAKGGSVHRRLAGSQSGLEAVRRLGVHLRLSMLYTGCPTPEDSTEYNRRNTQEFRANSGLILGNKPPDFFLPR